MIELVLFADGTRAGGLLVARERGDPLLDVAIVGVALLDATKRREKLRQLGGRAKNLEMEPDAIVRIQSFTARSEKATVLASVFVARNREL